MAWQTLVEVCYIGEVIAKTAAAGGSTLHPLVLSFSSSLGLDRALLGEDLVGSLAHLTMLARCGILDRASAAELHGGLCALYEEVQSSTLTLPAEEDVHMAVEALLAERLGDVAGRLHTARSRNDQVALDLRLHVREQTTRIGLQLCALIDALVARASAERDLLLPSYTHRQRAQPISAAYLLAAYASMLARDLELFDFVYAGADCMPLGVGAIAGTTLPIDRRITQELLGFAGVTRNGLDTVGDRDFGLDYTYAASRLLLHTSRIATDFVDFSTSEFGFLALDDEIACGSSMMPQKKNPDVFELVRGKSGQAIGNLTALLVTLKGLPSGYNRDQQEDRAPILQTAPLCHGVLEILQLALGKVHFRRERCLAALERDYTQATDLAEALVQKGTVFRVAYQAVGALVRRAQELGLGLAQIDLEVAQAVDPLFTAEVLERAVLTRALSYKHSEGSTGPEAVDAQLRDLAATTQKAKERYQARPRLADLFAALQKSLS